MPIHRQDEVTFWRNSPAHLAYTQVFAEAVEHHVASWVLGDDPDDPEAALALLMDLPPGWVLSRHSHDCHRFEVVIRGEMIVEGAVLKAGDVSTSRPGESYGPHMAGPEGCLSLEMFSRQAGMLPEQHDAHGGSDLSELIAALRAGKVTAEAAAASPVILDWAAHALTQQPDLQAAVRAREVAATPAAAHVAFDPAFEALVDLTARVEPVATGCLFTEGPLWHPVEQYLVFSDMPGDVRRRWDATGVSEAMRPANKCNGMTYDAALNRIVCEHSTSLVVRERPDGVREVLASHFEGQELNSPNDICVRSDGSIYFTDPIYGRMPGFGVERPRQLGWQGVFRIPPQGGEPELVVERRMFDSPNGLCFSPDEKMLYVNDTAQSLIRAFDVDVAGALSNMRIFAGGVCSDTEAGAPDGMKCDRDGNVWCTGPGGIWVYDPAGKRIGKIRVPERTANLHWGGPDWRSLFITATTSVYRLETKVGGRTEPFMRSGA